jgi:hypothetical protein
VTRMEHHDCLLGGALRRLLALEMLLQQMPNQPGGARAAFAFGVELGFERFGKLNVHPGHLHSRPPWVLLCYQTTILQHKVSRGVA